MINPQLRCGAVTADGPCGNARAPNRSRCAHHGGAPYGSANGRFRHGKFSAPMIEARKEAMGDQWEGVPGFEGVELQSWKDFARESR